MKRYVIEFANDCIKACERSGRQDLVERLERARNAYITGIMLNMDAMKTIIRIMEEE